MSSTSQKHRNFVSEPMSDKGVDELAGIGEKLSKRLEDKGFDKAYIVLGQYLVLKKNQELFIDWMKDICGANAKQAADCYQCLSDWCDEFLFVQLLVLLSEALSTRADHPTTFSRTES